MSYDDELAERVRALVAGERGMTEQRMFGGLSFLVDGNMSVAVSGQGGLLVRVDPADSDELLDGERVAPMAMGGRVMRGWLRVDAGLVDSDSVLRRWVARGVGYARSLPAKKAGKRARR